MVPVRPPALLRLFWPSLLWRMPAHHRTLYLTFDDGPTPGVTPWVLDTLREHEAQGTFFLVGRNAEQHPALVQRIRSEGHAIGNHTYSHLNGWRATAHDYAADTDLAQGFTGTRLFRPPYGRITRRQSAELRKRFTVVMWDALSMDFDARVAPEACLRNVLKQARAGSIIVFHDSRKAEIRLRHALPLALEAWREQGYRFAALPEMGITAPQR
ncbi:MAG: polysaccharide deacetylase family protein [Flavobacteriales bacterium]|jgi:peptidoglycan/xylan/chitin deacetylase (PgdA/CDA1 family)|nr:polysaccharide deacetylase family protein [Flavobacteriales bacterium]